MSWSKAQTKVTRIEITIYPDSGEHHVGARYEVALPGGRVVHQAGLTLHGPAGDRALPDDLAAAVQTLWEHAQRQVAEHEGLLPA
jgi:hypothetical protein